MANNAYCLEHAWNIVGAYWGHCKNLCYGALFSRHDVAVLDCQRYDHLKENCARLGLLTSHHRGLVGLLRPYPSQGF